MRKLTPSLIADVIFYALAAGFLSLGLMRYFRVSLTISLIVASLFTLAVGGLLALFLYSRRRKKILSKKEQTEREALMLHLTLEKEERVRAVLLAAFAADGREAHCEGDSLIVDDDAVVPLFTMEPVSADEVARLIRHYGEEPFTLLCNALSPEAEKLLASFGRRAVRGDEIYRLFSRTETTPAPLICGEIPRRTVKQKLRRTFAKSNARPFFVSGMMLLVMSLFTFFPTYYLISGSVLLVSSVFVRAIGYA